MTAYPSPESWQLILCAFFKKNIMEIVTFCDMLIKVPHPSKGLYLNSDLLLSSAHIQQQTHTHKSTDPHCHGAKRYSFKASGWERGPKAFGSAQTSQPVKTGSQVALWLHTFCELMFRAQKHDKEVYNLLHPFPLFGVCSQKKDVGGCRARRGGIFPYLHS